MSDIDKEAMLQHIRGATVVHTSPFSSIDVPVAEQTLSKEEFTKWVAPFYRVSLHTVDRDFMKSLKGIYREITLAIVELLLTEFNCRHRLTGAFFAALKRFDSFEDHIGRLLVRSDVCFAGKRYCVALAEINSPTGLAYLKKYLEYYLTRPDLGFDQVDAMCAIAYLDAKNGTKEFESFRPLWNAYLGAISWKFNFEEQVAWFANEMRILHECRAYAETSGLERALRKLFKL